MSSHQTERVESCDQFTLGLNGELRLDTDRIHILQVSQRKIQQPVRVK